MALESFDCLGPKHLTCVDWSNEHHRRSVAACLVQGVYVLELDREENRQGPKALASRWWELFGFRLHTPLVDPVDHSIFGAIYELIMPPSYSKRKKSTPRYIIAFRGVLIKPQALFRDHQHYLLFVHNGFHKSSRSEIALKHVHKAVADWGKSNLWLTGHSLGAAMAMLAGKTMAKTGVFLEAFLFNPPYYSLPIGQITRTAGSFVTAGLTAFREAVNGHNYRKDGPEDPFAGLSEWVPHLYVHPNDPICSEYIGYFDHRKKMADIGFGDIESVATRNSWLGLVMSPIWETTSETLYLIPSAYLTINLIQPKEIGEAHGICQWWRPDLRLQSKVYKFG